ncbi:MAG: penicillin-insensitive murein endopeptidase [Planctomycetes bacterium]|nr:penicillin-insensitive murein endopeptidase [Planctomycetota bacterium]
MTNPLPTLPAGRRRSTPRRLALPLAALSVVAAWTPPALAQALPQVTPTPRTPAQVTASALNVRTGPGTSYRVLGSLPRGTQVVIVGTSGNWRQIDLGANGPGWVYFAYLEPIPGAAPTAPAAPAAPAAPNAPAAPAAPGTTTGANNNQLATLLNGLRSTGTNQSTTPGATSPAATTPGATTPAATTPGATTPAATTPANLPPSPPSQPSQINNTPSKAGYIQLPASGSGYYGYRGANARWGTPRLVYGIERIGRRFAGSNAGDMGVGDLSLQNGGPISGHRSHQTGIDVDVRPVRTDKAKQPVTINDREYSQQHTRTLIGLFQAELQIALILFNDSKIPGVRHWPNHHNHFHARVR